MEFILKANTPKKRNEVKKTFTDLMILIKNKLETQHQKYYYSLILQILSKYKNINEDEIQKKMRLFKIIIHNHKKNKKKELKKIS